MTVSTKRIVTAMAVLIVVMAAPAQALAATAALWHMDEKSGTVMHDSVGNRDGTISHVRLGQPGFLQIRHSASFVRTSPKLRSRAPLISTPARVPSRSRCTSTRLRHRKPATTTSSRKAPTAPPAVSTRSNCCKTVKPSAHTRARCAMARSAAARIWRSGAGSPCDAPSIVFGDPEGRRPRLHQVDRSRLDRQQLAGRNRERPGLRLHKRPARRGRPDPRDITDRAAMCRLVPGTPARPGQDSGVMRPAGFEPATRGFEGHCSIP